MGLPQPKTYSDVRKLLEDKSIDCVSIATPNHWHSLIGIWACQAGKDVYVEKPGSHNWWDGHQLVRAAHKYDRMVQHGVNMRASDCMREAVQQLAQRRHRRCLHVARPLLQLARHDRAYSR